jgi:choline-sulfatase
MNTVFIVLDTVRKDRISVYNNEIDFTQNIEEFAKESTVFQDAVSQAPWTLPSHASMFTGQYPWEHNATQKQLYIETDKEILPKKFENEGYSTACFTSNTWISNHTGMADGFQEIDNFFGILPNDLMPDQAERVWKWLNHGRGEWLMNKLLGIGEKIHWMTAGMNSSTKTPQVINKAENFVEDNRDDDFFLFLNFMDAHLPYYPPEEYREKHAPDVDPKEICQEAHRHNGDIEEADFEASSRLYNAEMDFLDDQLGILFDYFEEEGLMEETVFILVSDHGENLGEDNMFGHQFSVSEKLVSVPLMIRAPSLEEDEIEEQIELRQLYNIIPNLAGFEDRELEFEGNKALGGYQRPKLDLRTIPDDKTSKFDKKLSFVRGEGKKLIRSETDEKPEDTMIDIETGEETEIDEDFSKLVDSIGEAEEGSTDIEEEEVKERLEELGYI